MQKILYFIPGFGENAGDKRYKRIIKIFERKGFKVITVHIDWKYRVMSDYIKQFSEIYNKNKNENQVSEIYFFGFSLGAYIALTSSHFLSVKCIFLASLSPYFKEDIQYLPERWKIYMGSNRMKDFATFHFDKVVKNVKSKVYLFAGDKEGEHIKRRFLGVRNNISNLNYYYIRNATHDVDNVEYYRAMYEVLEKDF